LNNLPSWIGYLNISATPWTGLWGEYISCLLRKWQFNFGDLETDLTLIKILTNRPRTMSVIMALIFRMTKSLAMCIVRVRHAPR